MLKVFNVEIILIILLLIFKKSESLKCIVCSSNLHKRCDYNIDLRYSKECDRRNGSNLYCRKISQILKFKGEKNPTFIRECAHSKEDSCYRFDWKNLANQQVCECDKDNCNSGRSNFPCILTVVVLFTLLWLISFIKKDHT